jgi:uncharacterized protein GlcG (DUF336 family)
MSKIRFMSLWLAVTGLSLAVQAAQAQVYMHGQGLPLALASQAAMTALNQCAAKGFPVSVAVLDPSGEMRVFLKADQATVHTKDSSFRKAYTIVTLGPIFHSDHSSEVAKKLQSNPYGSAFTEIPNILLLPGGAAVRVKGEIVAGIGVSGSPNGTDDEACAQAGIDAIQAKL